MTAPAGRDQVPGQAGRTAPAAGLAGRCGAPVWAAAAGPEAGWPGAGNGGAGAWPG
jgi:hypothetical protein